MRSRNPSARPRAPRRVALPLLAALLGGSASGESGKRWDLEDLLERVALGEAPTVEESTGTLALAGERGVERWFAAILQAPSGERGALLTRTREILDESVRRCEASADDATRRILAQSGLALMERIGGERDLDVALALGRAPEGADLAAWRPVRSSVEDAAAAILRREPRAVQRAADLYSQREWAEAYPLIRALSRSETPGALPVLARLLGLHPRNDGSVLGEVGNLAGRTGRTLRAPDRLRVRMHLTAQDTFLRRQAAYALGRLDDYDSVPDLIDRLRDQDESVQEMSHWALKNITRMTIHASPVRWRLWFEEESEWWAERAATLLETLRASRSKGELVAAINECGEKRLFRRDIAPELIPLLDDPDADVVAMTCSALLALRAREAAPALIRILEHPQRPVRSHAWRALRELTGESLPADPEAWRAYAIEGADPR